MNRTELATVLTRSLVATPSPRPSESPALGVKVSPREALWCDLDTWGRMDESEWNHEAVERLKNRILDVFAAHPEDAGRWYAQWRTRNPRTRLA